MIMKNTLFLLKYMKKLKNSSVEMKWKISFTDDKQQRDIQMKELTEKVTEYFLEKIRS